MLWQTVTHMTFLASALAIAWTENLTMRARAAADH